MGNSWCEKSCKVYPSSTISSRLQNRARMLDINLHMNMIFGCLGFLKPAKIHNVYNNILQYVILRIVY